MRQKNFRGEVESLATRSLSAAAWPLDERHGRTPSQRPALEAWFP